MKKATIILLILAFCLIAFAGCASIIDWLDVNAENIDKGGKLAAAGAAASGNPIAIGIVGLLTTIWGFYRNHGGRKIAKTYNDAFNATKDIVSSDDRNLLTKAIKTAAELNGVAIATAAFYKKYESSGTKDKLREHLALIKK